MKTTYIIEISIKTITGYVAYCQYRLGSTVEDAERIFAFLKGSPVNIEGSAPFQLNLLLHQGQKVIILASQYCTLAELKENTCYISMEVFKILNLK